MHSSDGGRCWKTYTYMNTKLIIAVGIILGSVLVSLFVYKQKVAPQLESGQKEIQTT